MASKKNPIQVVEQPVEKNPLLRRVLYPVFAILLFIVITLLYFSPMISGDSIIDQGDIVQFKGMSKELVDYKARTGEMSLWTNSMFGGMPAFTVYALYPGNVLGTLHSILTLGFPHPSGLLFLSMLTFYILMVTLRINPLVSIAMAVASGLAAYNLEVLEAGHNSKMAAIAYMPMVVAGVLLAFRNKLILGGIITAIALSLEVRAAHVQVSYYLMLMFIILGIVELVSAIRKKQVKDFAVASLVLLIAAGFGIITNAGYLMSMQEYTPSTTRGPSELSDNTQSKGGLDEDYAFDWSYGKMETFTLLIPNFYGGSSQSKLSENSKSADFLKQQGYNGKQLETALQQGMPTYWGDVQFTSGPVYLGAIVCFLFVLGLFILKDHYKWWLLAASILAIFLAWGRNLEFFNHFMFANFPGYDKFRTVTINFVVLQVTFPLLAALAITKLIQSVSEKENVSKYLLYSLYITGGLCLLFAVIGPSLFDFIKPARGGSQGDAAYPDTLRNALIADRKSMMQSDAFRSLIFIVAAFAALWFYTKQKIKTNAMAGILLLLVFIDLYTVGTRYLDKTDFKEEKEYMKVFQPTPADKMILQDKSLNYRVLNFTINPFNEAITSYHHKSIGGYNAAKLRRYQEIIEKQISRADSTGRSIGPNMEVLNMLNTKYLIVPDKNRQPVAQTNPNVNGNAWFVDEIQWVNNADEEMAALKDLDSKGTAVIDKRFEKDLAGFNPEVDSSATVTLKSYEPNHLTYQSKTTVPSLAVFSEVYYQPGWKSFIDGKEVPHVRANYILRAMQVPPGEHTIEFKFDEETYHKGESISRMSSLSVLFLSLIGIGWIIWNGRKSK
ncbi:MAG: hypothetical protein ACKVPJ_10105 [Chitinophagales bacterium]